MPIRRVMVAIMHASSGRHPFKALFGAENVLEFDPLSFSGRANDEFVAQATAFRPQWIHMQVQDSGVISAQSVRKVREALPRTVISHWMGDMRNSIGASLAEICRATHLTLISSVGKIDEYRATGAPRVAYHQVALDFRSAVLSSEVDWTPPFRVPDVVFCGNHYGDAAFPGHPDRMAIVGAFGRSGLDFGVVGGGWPGGVRIVGSCDVQQQQFVYKRAKIALSVNNFNGVELYYSDRHLHALFSGTATLCRHVPGLEREFTDGVHCVFFRTPEEAVASARRLLDRPDERARIALAGRAEAIRRHTFIGRILDLYPLIEEISASIADAPEPAVVVQGAMAPLPPPTAGIHVQDAQPVQPVQAVPSPPPVPAAAIHVQHVQAARVVPGAVRRPARPSVAGMKIWRRTPPKLSRGR